MGEYIDLALEARELNPELEGVSEESETNGDVSVTRIRVLTEEAGRKLGKKPGSYITLDAPALASRPLDLFETLSDMISSELSAILEKYGRTGTVAVVGLGNRNVTPDSLGPRTAERIFVTRHVKSYMPEAFPSDVRSVASVAPGVLGSTGVETFEIIKGLTERIRPDIVIAIDSLASRRASRISTTVQLSDTGIDPGSGVGNNRAGLSMETLGIPVIAVGVPLVVYASTITRETISMMADETGLHGDEEKLIKLADKVVRERMDGLIVTPKDIDSIVEDMSGILSNGVNKALFGSHLTEVRALIA